MQFHRFLISHLTNVALALSLVALTLTQASAQELVEQKAVAVPIESVVELTPANSSLSFVGIHVGDEPKPRLGGFGKFQGTVKVDASASKITSFAIDIDVDSVFTEFTKLTNHLKNADFFDVAKFPSSRFASTKIKTGENGQCTVTGDLTLHGETQSITFPATYRLENGGLIFSSRLILDRSRFGMDQMLSNVDKAVQLEISFGKKTVTLKDDAGPGGDSKKK
jgi:polyisoprenoid-binding protein YceI